MLTEGQLDEFGGQDRKLGVKMDDFHYLFITDPTAKTSSIAQLSGRNPSTGIPGSIWGSVGARHSPYSRPETNRGSERDRAKSNSNPFTDFLVNSQKEANVVKSDNFEVKLEEHGVESSMGDNTSINETGEEPEHPELNVNVSEAGIEGDPLESNAGPTAEHESGNSVTVKVENPSDDDVYGRLQTGDGQRMGVGDETENYEVLPGSSEGSTYDNCK